MSANRCRIRIISILESLEFRLTEQRFIQVGVPSFRATKDVGIKADLIEEITRIFECNIKPESVDIY